MGYGNCMVKEDFSWVVIFIRDEHNKKELPMKTCGGGKFPDEITASAKTLQQEWVCLFLEEKGERMIDSLVSEEKGSRK